MFLNKKEMDDAIASMVKAISNAIDKKIRKARFDKSSLGTVEEVLGNNMYRVNAFGGYYEVWSSLSLQKHDRVVVTVPQNNWNNMFVQKY